MKVSERPSRRLYTPTGQLNWSTIFKFASGIATAIGVVTVVVNLGVRYGEVQTTVANQTKEIQKLDQTIRDMKIAHNQSVDKLAYALRQQQEVLMNLRIAVTAINAVEEVRRGGTYDRNEVMGRRPPPAPRSRSRTQQTRQARRDAAEALSKARSLDPLAGLEGL